MAIGLGQMLIGGLLGNEIGKKGGLMQMLGGGGGNTPEMPEGATHTMPDGTVMPGASHPEQTAQAPQQQGGGFMDMINNISPEKMARMGMAFNSMRLRPDDNLAASFQTKINRLQTEKDLQKKTNQTIDYLTSKAVSTAYPNGRTDLIEMLRLGIISPTEALSQSMKTVAPSALDNKFMKYEALVEKYGGAENIPSQQLQLLSISKNEANSIEEYKFYKKDTKDAVPLTYKEFLTLNSSGTNVTVINEGDEAEATFKEENEFWKAYNKAAIPEIIKWQTKSSSTNANIVKLNDALNTIDDPSSMVSGPIIGQMNDFVLSFLNPEAVDTRESIESVVQLNLKAVLGGNFTEKEGEALIKRAYNPKLPQDLNSKRVRILIEQMTLAAEMQDARSNWIRDDANNGSLRGFDAPLPTLEMFYTALSANRIGDVKCNNGIGAERQCFEYLGGDDQAELSWKETTK